MNWSVDMQWCSQHILPTHWIGVPRVTEIYEKQNGPVVPLIKEGKQGINKTFLDRISGIHAGGFAVYWNLIQQLRKAPRAEHLPSTVTLD